MKTQVKAAVEFYDFEPAAEDIRHLVLQGLKKESKTLPCKLLYDEEGSRLFEKICCLEEYYPTRTEFKIFAAGLPQMASLIGSQAMIVEPGSGSAIKTEILFEHLDDPCAYVPVEISKKQLLETAEILAQRFPGVQVLPVCADYSREFQIPKPAKVPKSTVVFFPGSTIGNFEPDEAIEFLGRMAKLAEPSGGILIGADLRKDRHTVERAYNDRAGVTAAFNLNVLKRIAREFGVNDFSDGFYHEAVFDEELGRIEMYLVSARKQTIHLGAARIDFQKNEPICTEYSYKYTLKQFEQMASKAGLELVQVWTDPKNWFSMQYLMPKPQANCNKTTPYQNQVTAINAASKALFVAAPV